MKKEKSSKPTKKVDEMLPEYDFSSGVRGKHHKAYRRGHSVTVHKANGDTDVRYYTLEDGAVMLESDVRKYFPDSESVNRTLRGLINLLPGKRKIGV
jgi:hypothetical protein